MRTVFELMEKARETYSWARSRSDEVEKHRLLAQADSYLRQADALRRDMRMQNDEAKSQFER